jgi:tRNA A-37 threonylcarbamoyl transferase component Bud32
MLPENEGGNVLEKHTRQACADLQQRLSRGEDSRAENFLRDFPDLASDADRALDLIYAEYVARENLGQKPSRPEFLARFPQWRERLEKLFQLHDLMDQGEAIDDATVPEAVTPTGLPAGPWLDRYELLEEIGRGGMGIVYKARQVGLNRIVAYKTIKGGEAAEPEERARFREEAEKMARLKHPNVVPVYGVGECDGLPFFSMEFAEGGNLARRIAGQPQPARQAAEWVEALARAIHFAHQQGVIHRDLKPANVVLTADGTPKLTDFGLAKRLDGPQGQTQSGAVIGTPPYVSPEQAAGRTREIGPHSDTYSLGAILYELLTGRPPFRGETQAETLRQVIEEEPERPREVFPGVDRGLEAICLRCLEKAPERRYGSARALADDLERWRQGRRPLPLRLSYRVGRMLRRHAVAFTIGFLLGVAAIVPFFLRYEASMAVRLARIHQELKEGRTVTLVGDTGKPIVFQWRTASGKGRILEAADGAFTVEMLTVDDQGLLELLPNVNRTSYVFRAEVRHNCTAATFGTVGIYFGHSEHATLEGPEHWFCTLEFDDLKDQAKTHPASGGNALFLKVRGYREPTPTTGYGPSYGGAIHFFQPATPAVGKEPWHALAVKVTPKEVTIFWENRPIDKNPIGRDKLQKRAAFELKQRAPPAGIAPVFDPREALGLYVCQASASFRRVVVEPLDEDN